MAQLVVRKLEQDVKTRLRQRARRHGRSMEEEARDILRNAVSSQAGAVTRLGSRIADRFARLGLTEDFPELRGHVARPARFKK
jgi:plasmid stability protein